MEIKFGPTGLGSAKDAKKVLEKYSSLGFKACEIAFTYSVYIKEKDAIEIGKFAKESGIQLSIHAPYFINLNSPDKEKLENSKKRILKCLEIGTFVQAKYVVFHSGYYGKNSPEETYSNIKSRILEIEKIRKEKKYTPILAPEVMGKINVFGSIEEISKLSKEIGCSATIDFAHILARSQGDYLFEKTFKAFNHLKELHIHFSGMIYGEKGERKHRPTNDEEWKSLIKNLPKNKKIVIINESPLTVEDSVKGISIFKKLA